MRYAMEIEHNTGFLMEYSRADKKANLEVEILERRYVPGGIVCRVKVMDGQGWTGLDGWTEPETNIHYN